MASRPPTPLSVVRKFLRKRRMDREARRDGRMPLADVFSEIYHRDIWSNASGPGSDERFAAPYAALVSNFIRQNNTRSVVDVGCGIFASAPPTRIFADVNEVTAPQD